MDRRSLIPVSAFLLFLAVVQPAYSQTKRLTGTVIADAPIFLVPDATRVPLRVAKEGTVLYLLSAEGDWTQAEFNDPDLGTRVGYMQTWFIRTSTPPVSPVKPMDLSVTASEERATAAPAQTNPLGLQNQPPKATTKESGEIARTEEVALRPNRIQSCCSR
jgi:hypothetical protein